MWRHSMRCCSRGRCLTSSRIKCGEGATPYPSSAQFQQSCTLNSEGQAFHERSSHVRDIKTGVRACYCLVLAIGVEEFDFDDMRIASIFAVQSRHPISVRQPTGTYGCRPAPLPELQQWGTPGAVHHLRRSCSSP